MTPETAKALSELGRLAARQAGIPDDVPITMTLCPDREDLFRNEPPTTNDEPEEELYEVV